MTLRCGPQHTVGPSGTEACPALLSPTCFLVSNLLSFSSANEKGYEASLRQARDQAPQARPKDSQGSISGLSLVKSLQPLVDLTVI